MSTFAPNSRYVATGVRTFTLPDGREVNFLERRFPPQPESLALLGTYGSVLPDAVGILAFVASTAILLIGMVFRQI